jgi:hypothetical protein
VWYFGSMEGKFKGRLVKLSEALASEMEVA